MFTRNHILKESFFALLKRHSLLNKYGLVKGREQIFFSNKNKVSQELAVLAAKGTLNSTHEIHFLKYCMQNCQTTFKRLASFKLIETWKEYLL